MRSQLNKDYVNPILVDLAACRRNETADSLP